jgi:hypothetical protein
VLLAARVGELAWDGRAMARDEAAAWYPSIAQSRTVLSGASEDGYTSSAMVEYMLTCFAYLFLWLAHLHVLYMFAFAQVHSNVTVSKAWLHAVATYTASQSCHADEHAQSDVPCPCLTTSCKERQYTDRLMAPIMTADVRRPL